MSNTSEHTNNNSAALSEVPPIHSFEFDKNAIGNIKSSVNKFRGCVSLPIDFLTVPGREGLDVKISALYSSNIRNTLNTWNLDAPTGILGLGWQMPIERIVVDKAGSGSATSDNYYLVSNGSASPMVKTGESFDGKWQFQLRNFEFWLVQYDPGKKIWLIVKENGFVYTYGDGSDASSNATQWGVSWGNWMGSSSQRAAQEQFPLAWNLASIVTPSGYQIQYCYQNINQTVMSNGLQYTQASYLKQVIDSYGRTITFNYGDKFGALNPDTDTNDTSPIIEYQAPHTQPSAPNAYQDRYETLFLDTIDIADANGEGLWGLKFTYTFINHAPTGDSNYSLMYKRCLQSVFQYSNYGETLPAMLFEYVDKASNNINPGALSSVIYPTGGKASFAYKTNSINSSKKITMNNPLQGSTPRVWFGTNYIVFTYCTPGAMKVIVQSWDGQWSTQDVTGVMANKSVKQDSLMVHTSDNFFALSFRNTSTNNDELFLFRNDDRGMELRFGRWNLYNNNAFTLALKNGTTEPSSFIAGDSFVVAYNKNYSAGPLQIFSYTWQDGHWNTGSAPMPPIADMQTAAVTAFQNYYAVSCYLQSTNQLKNYIYYRDLSGNWKSSSNNSWLINNVTVLIESGQPYLAISPMPNGLVLTFATSTSTTSLNYSLKIVAWDTNFYVLNASGPVSVNLSSPINGGQPQYQIFRTVVVDSLVNNNLALLRNSGGDQKLSNSWLQKLFSVPAANANVSLASGSDAAIFCATTGTTQSNQLIMFNPNTNSWSTPSITQTEKGPSLSGNYMTLGRNIYYRKTDGTWCQLTTQLPNFNYPESLQNRGPRYMAYQDKSNQTYVVALKNGNANVLYPLGMEKMYAGNGLGTQLVGARFLVTYPAASSFDNAPSLNLYNLDEVNLDAFVVDYPVAYVTIEDAYDTAQNYYQSFFYANSSESQIVYNALTGVAQYPLVTVVPGVKTIADLPPQIQPQGRSQFYYSNGLAKQTSLYPSGGIQNYQNILNGIQLAQIDYDADNTKVSSQLNYWTVYSNDASGKNLYGGYARCERTVSMKDGVQQESRAGYDRTTGLMLWQEKTYYDAQGTSKVTRSKTLYAWQVEEYASAFKKQHLYTAIAMITKSVSAEDGSAITYIQSQATTYRNWANTKEVTVAASSTGISRLAAYQTFDWTTPGTIEPHFPSSNPTANWQLKTQIVSRSSPQGLITEQIDAMGLVSSFIYDKNQEFLLAKFPNGSISGDEVSYYGFEAYETDQGWLIGSGASVIPNSNAPTIDAHTGTRSLSIDPSTTGSNGIIRTFSPARQNQAYVFSAWVKKPTGFNPAMGQVSWQITVTGNTPIVLNFPDCVGQWQYVFQIITLPEASSALSIEIRCENANTASNVLVDNLRFSPLACPLEAYAYKTRFKQPDAMLGPNGETSRTVYDNFQQQILTTNPADKVSKIAKSYFSRSGNQNQFALSDPNHALSIDSAAGGLLTVFTRGSEWQSAWQSQGSVWQVDGTVLTQQAAGQPGWLTSADTALNTNYALAVNFNVLEAPTTPLGIQLGTGLYIQWNPASTLWQLLDANGHDIMPPVDVRALTLSYDYAAQLTAGTVSSALCSAFGNAGYLLPANSTVTVGAAGSSNWTLTSHDHRYCYALRMDGTQIAVYAMNRYWTLLAGENSIAFWADGKLIFSSTVEQAGVPRLFFGNRVAISQIALAGKPQASITFDDARGVTIQLQHYAETQMIVSQSITDNMGRVAVRTKSAYIASDQNPLFSYCSEFARMNWTEGKMTGLVNTAYPADEGYPFIRQTFETSPLARVTQESVPGALFIVGGTHCSRYAYSNVANTNGTLCFYKKTTTNPNGYSFYEVGTLLDQVIYRVSDKGGTTITNETLYDYAGNPIEFHSPNYFDPPTGSTLNDWVTRQTFDYANRLLTLQTGAQALVRFIYDAAGNIRFTQDAQGATAGTYSYTKYDVLSRPTESGYLTGSWNDAQLQQYANSDPSWPPTPPNWRKQYSYDVDNSMPNAIGRNTAILANNASVNMVDVSESFTYDIFGNIVSDTLVVDAYALDQNNRVDYEYDNVGNIIRIIYPISSNGTRFNVYYQINALNQIASISLSPNFAKPLGVFSYDASGNPQENHFELANNNRIKQTYGFNSPIWLTNIHSQNQVGKSLFQESISYTEGGYSGAQYYDGTIASSSIQTGGSNGTQDQYRYSYDSIGQVVNAENPQMPARNLGVTQPVNHDANGNFANVTLGGTPYQFNYYQGSQKLNTVSNSSTLTNIAQFSYDDNGNAIQVITAASEMTSAHNLTLTYDPATLLPKNIVDANNKGSTVNLTYGGRNERVLKQVSNGSRLASKKLYIRGTSTMPLMERTNDGTTETEVCYIFGPSGLIAMYRENKVYNVLKDHLGSVRSILDQQGNLVAAYEYFTYGGLIRVQEPTPGFMSYLYTGQEYDYEIDLYNYRSRFYCAGIGRFIAIDPARQYFSPYLYASNNPVLFIDPTGMFSLKSFFSAIGGILIGTVEILIGVAIDVVAGVLDVVTGGLSTPASVALAAFSGTFYGAGISAITYSVFNFDDFSWKDYGIQMGIGAVVGIFSGGAGPLISAGAKSAQAALTEFSQATRFMATVLDILGTEGTGATLMTGALKGGAWVGEKSATLVGYAINGPAGAGLTGLARNMGTSVLKSEAMGITWNTGSNLISGDPWDKNLGQTVFKSALSGSITGFQVKNRIVYGTA
jgi:RHS repeat-associated protein